VRARHLHNSGIRRYSQRERINGPMRLVPASFLESSNTFYKSIAETFPSHRGFRTDCMVKARCREIQTALMPYFSERIPRDLRRELVRAVSARTHGPPRPTDLPLASIAFREAMGYTLARLECGVSTHNNDWRPLVSVPQPLLGLQFTQAVS